MPAVSRVGRGRGAGQPPAVHAHVAALGRLEPHQRADRLGAARADQAGDAEDLAAAQPECDPADRRRRRDVDDVDEHLLARRRGALGEQRVDRPADHLRDQRLVGHLGEGAGGHAAAVAEHGEPIGDLAHFLEEMADVDDGHAARLQLADEREEPRHVLARQAAGRLVHQDDGRPRRHRPQDLDDLAGGDRQRPDDPIGGQVRMREALEQSRRLAPASRRDPASRRAPARGP